MSITTSAPAQRAPGPAPSPSRAGARSRLRSWRELARTTRVGRLAARGLLTLALVLLAGVLALVAVLRTQAASGTVVDRAAPETSAAQELYRALSSADAEAAQGFLAGAAEPAALREQYQTDITRAGAALADVTRGAGTTADTSDASADPARVLATGLPVYTGLVETARTADRQGLAVGAAYLREASSFLQTTLLPATQALYASQATSLADQQDVADGGVWTLLALVAVVVALVAVIVLHRRIARTTKRRVTPGVVLGAAALALLLVWGVAALATASVLMTRAQDDGTTPNREAVASRFALLQARTDDVLALVARGSGDTYEAEYDQRTAELLGPGGHLEQAERTADADATDDLGDARAAAGEAVAVHDRIRSLDAGGGYDQAVALALSTAPDGGAGTVTRTADALGRAIDVTAATAADDASDADAATTALSFGVVVLTLVALAGVGAGLWPRLQEYR